MKEISLLEEGVQAPEFNYRDSEGQLHASSELNGKAYLIYFYPKDNTPGCNKEACGFRDHYSAFDSLGVSVIGVSCDSEKSHQKFREKFSLPFSLIADEDQSVVNAFGVFGKKKFMGKTYEGIHRVSYLIDPKGMIAKVYPKVKPAEHAEQVIQDIKELRLGVE